MKKFVFSSRKADVTIVSADFESAVYKAAAMAYSDANLEKMLSSKGILEVLAEMGVYKVTSDHEVIIEL